MASGTHSGACNEERVLDVLRLIGVCEYIFAEILNSSLENILSDRIAAAEIWRSVRQYDLTPRPAGSPGATLSICNGSEYSYEYPFSGGTIATVRQEVLVKNIGMFGQFAVVACLKYV